MSDLNDVERLSTVLDWRTQVFFPQRYNSTALKVVSLGDERKCHRQKFHSLFVGHASGVMQEKRLVFIF